MNKPIEGRIFILAPKKRDFGCGITDHTAVLRRGLAAAGLRAQSLHFDGSPFDAIPNIAAGDIILLQLSIYGYSKRGTPHWLPNYLRKAKRQGAQLVTFFHELWVSWSRPTSSAFWLAPIQFSICRQILQLSETAIFNAEWGYQWAIRNRAKHVEYIQTFSNVGEPAQCPDWLQRQNNLVVFGNPKARAEVYGALTTCSHVTNQPNMRLGIVDIGESNSSIDTFLNAGSELHRRFPQVHRTGPLPSEEVSAILSNNKFGLFAAPWNHAGKSGVLAAFIAHGVCPISIHSKNHIRLRAQFAPKPDVHFALLQNLNFGTAQNAAIYRAIAEAARRSYDSSHRLVQLLTVALHRASDIQVTPQ